MIGKPQLPSLMTGWAIYRAVHGAVWLGTVDATDEANAIEKGLKSLRKTRRS